MHGEKPEVLDGTQMSADWTFSGLQKFGQGLQDRLRGHKLPSKLLEKVNYSTAIIIISFYISCIFRHLLICFGIFLGQYCWNPWYFGSSQTSFTIVPIQRCLPMVHRSCRYYFIGIRSSKIGRRSRNRSHFGPIEGTWISNSYHLK